MMDVDKNLTQKSQFRALLTCEFWYHHFRDCTAVQARKSPYVINLPAECGVRHLLVCSSRSSGLLSSPNRRHRRYSLEECCVFKRRGWLIDMPLANIFFFRNRPLANLLFFLFFRNTLHPTADWWCQQIVKNPNYAADLLLRFIFVTRNCQRRAESYHQHFV